MIIFCHLLNDRSGSPTVLRSTLDALDASERGLLFVGSQGRGVLEDAGVRTQRYWYRRSRYRMITFFTFFISQIMLYRALAKTKDLPSEAIVFVNTLLPFAAMLWGRRTGRRVVVHVHEASITPSLLKRFLTRCAGRSADLLLYVSKDHRARLPIDGPPALILPNPVGKTIMDRANGYVPRLDRQHFRILMLASLRGYKGISEFMALAARLQYRKDISFDLVLNAEATDVAAFAKRHSDAANVNFYPRSDEPAQFYRNADLVLNLTRIEECIETFGLTLVEAMTFGLPVIAPPVGGPVEIVTHGINGFCIDSRDVGALHKAVLGLADCPETYDTMSKEAWKRSQDFSFTAYAEALRAALNTLG